MAAKVPLTPSGIPAAMLPARHADPTPALGELTGDTANAVLARANLTVVHASTAPMDGFDMVYLSLSEGEALVTLGADVSTEVRVDVRVAQPTFGDSIVDANGVLVGYAMREDESAELEGTGALSVTTNRSVVEVPAQHITNGDILLLEDARRVVQTVSQSGGTASIHLDRDAPANVELYENWRYVRRAAASAHGQLRKGEGALSVTGNAATYASYGSHAHALFAGDTVAVGLYARTVQEVSGNAFVLDEAISDILVNSEFAWMPPEGQTVLHALLKRVPEANMQLYIGNVNIDGETGSFGSVGSVYGLATGSVAPRYLDPKDVLHCKVRSGYRQVLGGYPLPSREAVANGAPPLVCAQSISAAAAQSTSSQNYHGYSTRVEPPQTNLTRFLNV